MEYLIPIHSRSMSFNFLPIDQEFQDAIAFLKQEYLQISTGRANPSLLDSLYIESGDGNFEWHQIHTFPCQ